VLVVLGFDFWDGGCVNVHGAPIRPG